MFTNKNHRLGEPAQAVIFVQVAQDLLCNFARVHAEGGALLGQLCLILYFSTEKCAKITTIWSEFF